MWVRMGNNVPLHATKQIHRLIKSNTTASGDKYPELRGLDTLKEHGVGGPSVYDNNMLCFVNYI